MKKNNFRLSILSAPQVEKPNFNCAYLQFGTTIISSIFEFTEYRKRKTNGLVFYDFYNGTILLGCVKVLPDMLVEEEVR